ncbi:MAG: PG0541 family transporter-associated protein [Desulfosoma sp.]
MDMYWIFYDASFDEDVMETLDHCCVTGFTKWDRVLGKGPHAVPKMDNAVWPGYNCAVLVAVPDEESSRLKTSLQELRRNLGGRGMEIFRMAAERIEDR